MHPSSESVLRIHIKRNALTHSKKGQMQDYVGYRWQLPSSFSSQCLYWKRRSTIVIWAWHTGQPESSSATRRAQLSQKRACPHGTNANPSRGATRHTSQNSSWAGGSAAAKSEAVDVVAVVVGTWVSSVSSLLLLLSSVGCSASACAPMVFHSRVFSAPPPQGVTQSAHSRQKLHSSVGATTECGHARLDALIVQHVGLFSSVDVCLTRYGYEPRRSFDQ